MKSIIIKTAGLFICWLFLLTCAIQAAAQIGIEPEIVTTCNDPDVSIHITHDGTAYTISIDGLTSGKTIRKIEWRQGENTGNTIPPVAGQTTYSFIAANTGIIYIDVAIGTNSTLSVTGVGVTVSINDIQQANASIEAGTAVKVVVAAVNNQTNIRNITGYSADKSLIISGTGSTIEFTMPASDLFLQVNTVSTTPPAEMPDEDKKPEAPVITIPDGAVNTTPPAPDKEVCLQLVIDQPLAKDSSRIADVIKDLQTGDNKLSILELDIRLEKITTDKNSGSETRETLSFTQKPVIITLPYPAGVTREDRIVIYHLTGSGQTEIIYPTQTDNWLRFSISRFSPFIVTVSKSEVPVTGVSVSPVTLTLKMGSVTTGQLTAIVEGGMPDSQGLIWESANPTVATVDAAGVVNAIAPGTTTIKARTEFGGYEATCTVVVQEADPAGPGPDPEDPEQPVANERVTSSPPTAYGTKGGVILHSITSEGARIYNVRGILVRNLDRQSGTRRVLLPASLYIVRFTDGTTRKIVTR